MRGERAGTDWFTQPFWAAVKVRKLSARARRWDGRVILSAGEWTRWVGEVVILRICDLDLEEL